jgi:excisionase family DNA binding protein
VPSTNAQSREDRSDDVPRLALSPEEAALATGIGRTKMYELLASQRIKSIRVGRRLVVPMVAIEAFLAASPDDAT